MIVYLLYKIFVVCKYSDGGQIAEVTMRLMTSRDGVGADALAIGDCSAALTEREILCR
jgi:hypothetical protein